MSDEYGYTEEDTQAGSGQRENKPKPIGVYTAVIERAEAKKDKNGKLYLKWWNRIAFGPYKNQIAFEGYLPLSRDVNAYQLARRNSFAKATGQQPGQPLIGTPNGAPAETLNGTYVDFTIQHQFENVPGEQYPVTTGSKQFKENYGDKLNAEGNLVVNGVEIKPSAEVVTFYEVSDEFEGIGGSSDSFIPEAAPEEVWG